MHLEKGSQHNFHWHLQRLQSCHYAPFLWLNQGISCIFNCQNMLNLRLTVVSSSCNTWSYSLMATQNIMAVTSSKQWIHFLRSDLCPPTSNNLKCTGRIKCTASTTNWATIMNLISQCSTSFNIQYQFFFPVHGGHYITCIDTATHEHLLQFKLYTDSCCRLLYTLHTIMHVISFNSVLSSFSSLNMKYA